MYFFCYVSPFLSAVRWVNYFLSPVLAVIEGNALVEDVNLGGLGGQFDRVAAQPRMDGPAALRARHPCPAPGQSGAGSPRPIPR